MPAVDLRGKPIAITGASSGIGLATAVACARAGMPVVVSARRADRLAALVERIRREGGQAEAVTANVDDPADAERIVLTTVERFGSIYAAFANAGYGLERPIEAMTDAEMRAIFETNFFGSLNLIRPALARMRQAGAGHILICSSCISKVAIPFHGAYCATKAAQDHIGRAMRLELAGTGVHVSTVHPVGTRTEFFAEEERRSGRPSMEGRTPERFMQSPERVARAVVRCLRRPRGEVWTSTSTRLAFGLFTAFPGITDWVLRGYAKKRNRLERTAAGP